MDNLYTHPLQIVDGLHNLLSMATASLPLFDPQALASTHAGLVVRVERTIEMAMNRATGSGCPPRLGTALRYAVFAGGARLRPQLVLVAALAGGDACPEAADGAAAAIELLHCASLVHDDLPCFDDAGERRGKPSLHRAFDEATAVLVGDALIVLAFTEVARGAARLGARAGELTAILARAAGPTRGIVAGQAWESEPQAPLDEYHRAKTASLFEAAAAMGAVASGADAPPWAAFGEALGRVYQAADDLADVVGDARVLGKPTGRDAAKGRPNLARVVGVGAARARAVAMLDAAIAATPRGRGEAMARAFVERLAARAGLT